MYHPAPRRVIVPSYLIKIPTGSQACKCATFCNVRISQTLYILRKTHRLDRRCNPWQTHNPRGPSAFPVGRVCPTIMKWGGAARIKLASLLIEISLRNNHVGRGGCFGRDSGTSPFAKHCKTWGTGSQAGKCATICSGVCVFGLISSRLI